MKLHKIQYFFQSKFENSELKICYKFEIWFKKKRKNLAIIYIVLLKFLKYSCSNKFYLYKILLLQKKIYSFLLIHLESN